VGTIEDLYLLGYCDYIVGPNSSFSQWASFWGGVPLHVLDWKSLERHAPERAIRRPEPAGDFRVYGASDFGDHSSRRVSLTELRERDPARVRKRA